MEDAQIFRKIYKEPSWFLRWGTWLLFLFFCTLVFLSFFFSYNEVINGKVTITSENPPVHVQANQTGRLLEFHFNIGDEVFKDEVLALVENSAAKRDVYYLKKQLLLDEMAINSMEELRSAYPLYLKLGNSIQPYFKNFLNVYQEVIMNGTLKDDEVLREQLREQLNAHNISLRSKAEELAISEKSMGIVHENHKRNKMLFKKGIISKHDFETVEKELNEEQIKVEAVRNDYKVLLSQRREQRSRENQLKNLTIRNNNHRNTELIIVYQELLNAVSNWETQFILKSPIDGRVSFIDEWGKVSRVSPGEIVFTISPRQQQKLIGKATISGVNSGKLKKGQRAIVNLDSYPSREWGTVNAVIMNFVQLPGKSEDFANLVYFEIPELTTSYGRKLEFRQDLSGTVKILLDEITIMERIFYQFRHLWMNTETL